MDNYIHNISGIRHFGTNDPHIFTGYPYTPMQKMCSKSPMMQHFINKPKVKEALVRKYNDLTV